MSAASRAPQISRGWLCQRCYCPCSLLELSSPTRIDLDFQCFRNRLVPITDRPLRPIRNPVKPIHDPPLDPPGGIVPPRTIMAVLSTRPLRMIVDAMVLRAEPVEGVTLVAIGSFAHQPADAAVQSRRFHTRYIWLSYLRPRCRGGLRSGWRQASFPKASFPKERRRFRTKMIRRSRNRSIYALGLPTHPCPEHFAPKWKPARRNKMRQN